MEHLIKTLESVLDRIKEIADEEPPVYASDPRLLPLDGEFAAAINALLDARFPGVKREPHFQGLAFGLSFYVEFWTPGDSFSATLRIANHRNVTRQHTPPAGNIVCGDSAMDIKWALDAVDEELAEWTAFEAEQDADRKAAMEAK